MELDKIMPIIIAALSLLVAALSLRRAKDGDSALSIKERATMAADIRYIRDAIDDIKVQYKSLDQSMHDHESRLVAVEQSCKSAHHRLDDLIQRMGGHINE